MPLSLFWSMAIIGGGLVFYAVLVNRLLHLVQPVREYCATSGESLIVNGKLPPEAATQLRGVLDNAYNEWMPWLAIVAWIIILVRTPFKRPLHDPANGIKDEQARAEFTRIRLLLLLCSVLVSPLATVVLVVELLTTIILLVLVVPTWSVIGRALRNTLVLVETLVSEHGVTS